MADFLFILVGDENIFVKDEQMSNSVMIMSILVGIFLSLIAFITALGNIIVLLAFYCDKKLRTINGNYTNQPNSFHFLFFVSYFSIKDYFILNMAIADFLVGFICIPFYIPFRFYFCFLKTILDKNKNLFFFS